MSAEVVGLIARNVAYLLALAVVFDIATTRFPIRGRPRVQLVAGVAVGVLGAGIVISSYDAATGMAFDSRSVLLAVSGLFLGAGPTVVAMAITAAARLGEGGAGMWTGVLLILASGAIGIVWRQRRGGELEDIRPTELYLFGLAVHVAMLLLLLTVPPDTVWPGLPMLAIPILIVLPAATAALGALLAGRLRRERVAAQLEDSEARYRSLFEDNRAIMLLIDATDGGIVDANLAAVRFYGWTLAELRQRGLSDISLDEEDVKRAKLERARAGVEHTFRCRHRLASGEVRDVESVSGQMEVEGRSLMYAIIHDVTGQREAEEALRLRSAALEAAANAIVITDRSGAIEWVNKAFTELTGYTFDEAVGRNPRDVVRSGVHDSAFYSDLWRTVLAGETWRGRITNRRKDGTLFEEDMAITPLRNEAGAIAHFIAVKQDLTEWQAMEQRLAVSQKLESVGKLAGGVAHDFNNLLTVVNGTLDLILTELPADHPLRHDLEEVRHAGERGSALTRQLLAFSRRQVMRKELLDLHELLSKMMSLLRRLIGEDVEIMHRLEGEPPFVLADRTQLEQVVVNLVVNARDAMPGGGTLAIETGAVDLEQGNPALLPTMSAGPYARITFRDSGTGIDAAIQSRIFDPFFTTKEPGKGTGLGLATVYGIVTQSGGNITVSSEPGEGTTFAIYLPRSEAGTAAVATETRTAVRVRHGTIVVVDDEDGIRRLAERILRRAGYEVLSAGSGAEALELLEEHGGRVDLLFTDVVMPDMSGPQLVRRATALYPDLKVLYASGYTIETLTHHGLSGAGHDFMAKPYTADTLILTVRTALESR